MPLSVQLFFGCFPADEDEEISYLVGVREDIEDWVSRAPPCGTAVEQINVGKSASSTVSGAHLSDSGASSTVSSEEFPPLLSSEGRELGEVAAWINISSLGLPVLQSTAGFLLITGPLCGPSTMLRPDMCATPRTFNLLGSVVDKASFLSWLHDITEQYWIDRNPLGSTISPMRSSLSRTCEVKLRQPTRTETSSGLKATGMGFEATCMVDFSMEPDEQMVVENLGCDLMYIVFVNLKETRLRKKQRSRMTGTESRILPRKMSQSKSGGTVVCL
jgi:hypothetical protein